jgi:hypothetical protein
MVDAILAILGAVLLLSILAQATARRHDGSDTGSSHRGAG